MLKSIPVRHLGKKRDKFTVFLNNKVGRGNWFWGFQLRSGLYSWSYGLQIYEDAYWCFLKNNLTLLKELVKNYGDVYVIDKSDLSSGLDYKKQLQSEDHYADIAIRRSLRRLGLWFQGEDLLKIPASEFSESSIPFHLKYLIRGDKVSDLLKHLVAIVAPDDAAQHELSKKIIQ